MNNEEILNELFFKKKSYIDNLKDKQAQYTPVSNNDNNIKNLFQKSNDGKISVTDMDAVKKSLVGALGMAMGNNTVRSMASRAIKSFPIIVSDDISSETLVMMKNMMEEEYASYIDLLVSNQIINITDYKPGSEDGNIAIQALNKLDGTEFGMNRIAKQAQTGKLSLDDVFKNQPWWQLIRSNTNETYKTGNPLCDILLENAIIVPSEYENDVVQSLLEKVTLSGDALEKGLVDIIKQHFGDNFVPKEGQIIVVPIDGKDYGVKYENGKWQIVDPNPEKASRTSKNPFGNLFDDARKKRLLGNYDKFGKYYEVTNGTLQKKYDKLISPNILVGTDNELDEALDENIAELMLPDKDDSPKKKEMKEILKDRFTKANYLLLSRRISGTEYISYLVDRLGIPVSDKLRRDILIKFKVADVVFKGTPNFAVKRSAGKDKVYIYDTDFAKTMRENIETNESYLLKKIIPPVTGIKVKDVAKIAGLSIGAGAIGSAIGTGIAATTIGLGATMALPIILIPALAGAIGTGVYAWWKKRKAESKGSTISGRIEGWERVETLIDEMDSSKKEFYERYYENNETFDSLVKKDEEMYNRFSNNLTNVLKDVAKNNMFDENFDITSYVHPCSDNHMENLMEDMISLEDELQNNYSAVKENLINEAKRYTISTSNPSSIVIKNVMTGTNMKVKPSDLPTIVPEFGTKDVQAYGSVEYDKRDMKDRKFNDPLILTIRFKERYSDDKFSDNELTAVIGIKGVVTRVPSAEMEEVLRSNVEGKTLANFFKGDEKNNAKNLIGNVISSFMGTKYAEKLPTSGKIWSNLEKVGQLAIANKLAGNNNGNISNAHLIFSQKEIDRIKNETGVNYLKDPKISAQLMKKYSAFMLAVCDDALQKVYTFSDPDAISWDDAPYSAYIGKSNSDQLISAFTQAQRMRL